MVFLGQRHAEAPRKGINGGQFLDQTAPADGEHRREEEEEQSHPVRYCLLNDFHSTFLKGQSIAQSVRGNTIRLEGALMLSRRYKAALKRAIKMVERAEYNEGQSQERVQQLGEQLCSTELLWSLIEAVSIRPSHNLIVIDLLEWARECFPSAQSIIPSTREERFGESSYLGTIIDELVRQERPEDNDSYWNAVIRQALCADFPSVATLLQFHSAYKSEPAMAKVVRILQSADKALLGHDRSSCGEFEALQKKVSDLLQTQQFRVHDNLGVVCSLFRGDRGTFAKYFNLFRPNWFEVFPAFMLFFSPAANGDQIPKVIEAMFSLVGLDRGQLGPLEHTMLAILELDLIRALKLICSGGGPSACWFAAHLVDLLHFHDPTFLNPSAGGGGTGTWTTTAPGTSAAAAAFLSDAKLFGGESLTDKSAELDLRSRLLVEYGQLLFRDGQLWEIAPDYVSAVGLPSAMELMDKLVARLDWHGNTGLAQRMLTICDRFDLFTAREHILKGLTMKFCRQGDWSAALGWALRMRSLDLTAHVARRILQGAIPAHRIGQMRVFDALAGQFVDCGELILLYKFYTFKRQLLAGELKQAVQLLHELFLDNLSPMEFHVVLCEEMCRILVTFQRAPLLGDEAFIAQATNAVPGMDRQTVQDMFRALSMFQMQQNLLRATADEAVVDEENEEERQRTAATAPTESQHEQQQSLFPPLTSDSIGVGGPMGRAEVHQRMADLMDTLRPMLAEALAACTLR